MKSNQSVKESTTGFSRSVKSVKSVKSVIRDLFSILPLLRFPFPPFPLACVTLCGSQVRKEGESSIVENH
jgi:hypothetical protein